MSFSAAGATVASGATHVSLSLAGFGYASALRPVGPASPRVSANRVAYYRGILREWYANGPLGLEQGFDVARSPARGPGPLTFALALSGNLGGRLEHGSVRLSGVGVSLRYGGLRASDARGHALRSWLVVRPTRLEIRVDDHGAAYPLRIDPFIAQAVLSAADGGADDTFGISLAASGDTIVVGAAAHSVAGSAVGGTGSAPHQGAAYVFVKPPSGWANATDPVELTARDGADGDRFGSSVAISGDTIVVGARRPPCGRERHCRRGIRVREAGLRLGERDPGRRADRLDGAPGDSFGYSVAISGDTIVVGPFHTSRDESQPGRGLRLRQAGLRWANATQNAELTASDGAANDYMGYSGIGISGDTIVAGSGYHGGPGAAYVFVMPASGWKDATQTAELTPSDGAAGDYFAYLADAVSGDTVVIGAGYHKVGANAHQGAAYVFVKPASGWANETQTAELTASDGAAEDYFGYGAVAISGDTVVVGAAPTKSAPTPTRAPPTCS